MADTKISALTGVTTAAGSNELPVNEAGASKKVTIDQILTYLQTKGMPRVKRLTGDHTLASATATKLTDLDMTLEAGTYTFQYSLIMQSSATGTGLSFGLNFSGTAAVRAFQLRYPSTGTTANTGVADDVGALTGEIHESNPQTAFSTTTGNLTFTGVATANANILGTVEGVMVVTASGDIQLYHGSEGAVNTSVMAGSSLVVIRTA